MTFVAVNTGAIVEGAKTDMGIVQQRGSGTVVNAVNNGDGGEMTEPNALPPRQLTERDLRLGKKAAKYSAVICAAAFAACLGIAIYVLFSVPLGTRMPYSGQYGRNGIPMPLALLPALVVLSGLFRGSIKPTSHHMGKVARGGLYSFGTAMVLGCVILQWVFAKSILIEAGALPG